MEWRARETEVRSTWTTLGSENVRGADYGIVWAMYPNPDGRISRSPDAALMYSVLYMVEWDVIRVSEVRLQH